MRPTPNQLAILARIEDGAPVTESQVQRALALGERDPGPLEVAAFQWSRDGQSIVAHRTILADDRRDPRLSYRVEMYRIQRDGAVTKL